MNLLRKCLKSLGLGWMPWMNDLSERKWNIREIGWDCVDWTDLAQDRDQWRALVNMALNLHVP
jgi:hypothetical protein